MELQTHNKPRKPYRRAFVITLILLVVVVCIFVAFYLWSSSNKDITDGNDTNQSYEDAYVLVQENDYYSVSITTDDKYSYKVFIVKDSTAERVIVFKNTQTKVIEMYHGIKNNQIYQNYYVL